VPWAVKFPQDILAWPTQSPDKLALLEPLVAKVGVNASLWKQWTLNLPIYYGKIQATLYSLIDAIQSGNQELRQGLGQYLVARHPSQIYAALLEGALVFFVLLFFWRRPQKPGVIAAIFGITYAVVRIIGEAFRMPDAHIGFEIFGFTRGQLLSFVMLAVMIALLFIAKRRNVELTGGWLRDKTN
jgi:phosphatidylglycerol:prolipoprotein diacylglycerol transferase